MLASRRARPWWPEAVFLVLVSIMAAWVVNVGRPEPLPWRGDFSARKVEEVVRKGFAVVSPDEARAMLMNRSHLFVDARDPGEFAEGHIPGALNISEDAMIMGLDAAVSGIEKARPMVVYCGNLACPKSKDLARALEQMGFTAVWVMPEGVEGWKAVGGPVEAR